MEVGFKVAAWWARLSTAGDRPLPVYSLFFIFVLFLRGPKVRVFWSFYFALFFIFGKKD